LVLEDLHRAAEIASFETWLREHQQQLAAELGSSFIGADTDWAALFKMLDWTEEFLRFAPHQQLPEKMAELICREGDEAARTALSEVFNATRDCLERVRIELEYAEKQVLPRHALLPIGKTLEMVTPLTVRERVDFYLDQLPQLGRWLTCKQRIEQCNQHGLGGFITRMLSQHPFPRSIAQIFERRFYVLWLDEVRRQSPTLSQFQGEIHQKQIDLFRQLDERHQRLAQQRLRSRLLQRRSALLTIVDNRRNAIVSNALTDLTREAQKKRHPPIRQIVRRVAPALLEIKPCWMMSPLSVSQFLESGSQLFDLVIFDEASQVCPEDAIAAILRGKQLIVVGDSKQLPPTRFFSKTLADEEEEELPGEAERLENERMESILDECMGAGLSQRSLRWHYRSRHESLIAFSNHHFYQNRLVTFPSSTAEHKAGVRFVYVAGAVYDRGGSRTNKREAERVAQLVFEHFRQKPKQSLGVVALSEAQQQAIRDAIEAGIRRQPELKAWEKELTEDNPAGFFVKNLESVQGDERDVIILSIGYGPDASGRVHQNFGPVNKAGGERRLNVAVTRARHQVIVVASMRASDLSGDLNSPGARTLRSYLAYAERGPAVLSDTALAITPRAASQEVHFDSPFEEAVYHALTAKGLQLDTQVGCSEYRIDLAVLHPQHSGTYVMGIECDGRTYHSSATARDRDRLRQRHLEQMGWTIHRIWSTDWLRNPAHEVTKVLKKYDQLQKYPDLQKESPEKTSPAPPAPQTKPSISHEEKPTQEFFASNTVWHPAFGYGTVVRGTIAFQGNAVEVEFSKSVGRKIIDLRETSLEKVKLDKQFPQTKPGSTQAPAQANRISQKTLPQTPASNLAGPQMQKPEQKFSTDDSVRHPIYGIGKVVSGGDTVIEVDFGGHTGRKTLFPEKTHLEKVHTGAAPSNGMPRQDTPPKETLSLSAFLRDKGLIVIDKRPIGGALWVVGGRELSPIMESLQKKGIKFVFAPNGSRSTGNKPAWFMQ
jgi:very-short-patch-repair endonuclease